MTPAEGDRRSLPGQVVVLVTTGAYTGLTLGLGPLAPRPAGYSRASSCVAALRSPMVGPYLLRPPALILGQVVQVDSYLRQHFPFRVDLGEAMRVLAGHGIDTCVYCVYVYEASDTL